VDDRQVMAEPDRKRLRRSKDHSHSEKSTKDKLVEKVNSWSGPDFFANFDTSEGISAVLKLHPRLGSLQVAVSDISPDNLEECLRLIETTSAQDYETSEIKWSPSKKRKEMKLPDMKYILLTEQDRVIGFISFMVTYEDGNEVVYIYEIHFSPDWQGKGLGRNLMDVVEVIGRNVGVTKVMLTVFKANERAVQWYTKLDYVEDEFSPAPRKLRNGTVKEPTYIILSKSLTS
jgi:ribosomal protein S18 acetylase RimI-like enzyme